MISMIRKPTAFALALLAIGLLGTSAHADLTVTVSEDGATSGSNFFTTTVSGTPNSSGITAGTLSVTTNDYQINVVSGTEIQNTLSEVLSSTTSITRTSSSGTHTLLITITGTGFTAPVTPPNITGNSQIGGSIVQTASNDTLNYQSFVNSTGFGVQSPAIGGQSNSSYNNTNPPFTITSLSSGFSLTETIGLDLTAKNDQINYSSSTTLNQVVPEPSSMAIAGLGALGMIGYGLRRRKAKGA